MQLPLSGYKSEDIFKVYIVNSGLFLAMLDEGSVNVVINNNLKIYNGDIYENTVAESFLKNNNNLYYYNKNSEIEIDFVGKVNNELTLIEVKTNNGDTKSLKDILQKRYLSCWTCYKANSW